MCNVTIAKTKLKNLKIRTEKDLYGLEFDSMDFESLTDDIYLKVKVICNDNGLNCPLYKYSGKILFKDSPSIYSVLRTLAKEHGIYLDYTKISA